MVMVTATSSPDTWKRSRIAASTRSQAIVASPSSSMSSISTANSSPPSRATVSSTRTAERIRATDLVEQLVAGGVPEQVVDALEAVQVAEQDGEARGAAALPVHRVLHAVHEQ